MDEIANPFTFPPSQYRLYTKRNLVLLDLLRSRSGTKLHDELSLEKQTQLLEDQGEPLDWTLARLERPRADWIEQEGGYETFGEFWPLPGRIASLEEQGVLQLYPNVPDHRPALRKLLRTILTTYNELVGALLVPPAHDPASQHQPHESQEHVDWLQLNATNMIAAINELRPVQARATLEAAMLKQLNSRREATKAIHSTCDELEAQLAALQVQAASKSAVLTVVPAAAEGSKLPSGAESENPQDASSLVSDADLDRWADQVSLS